MKIRTIIVDIVGPRFELTNTFISKTIIEFKYAHIILFWGSKMLTNQIEINDSIWNVLSRQIQQVMEVSKSRYF